MLGNYNNSTKCCRIGCVEKKSSHLTSIDISSENKLYMPTILLSKMYYMLPQQDENCVCKQHNMEFNQLFHQPSSSSLYVWEYDEKSGTIDYYSKKKTARKNFERVLSFTPLDNGKYKLSCAMIDSCDVSDLWLKKTLNSLAHDSPSSNIDDKSNEYDKQRVSPTSIVDSIFEMKANKEFKKDFKIIDYASVIKFCKYFFSCDPMAIEEEITLLSNQEIPTPKANSNLSISPILISLEGNIGAGKSYLLGSLRQLHPEWVFIDEPVSFWQSLKNDNNESLLEVFYKDQSRWSYTFQNCALLSRFSNIETTVTDYSNKISQENISKGTNGNNIRKPVVFITERCLDTDHEVFAKMLHADGQLDSLEFDLYERWFALLMQTATPLSAIVYVDTMPNTCSDRIRMRNRDGEDSIPLAYLSSLDLFQRKWIDSTNVPVIRTVSDDNQKVTDFVEHLVSEAIKKQLC